MSYNSLQSTTNNYDCKDTISLSINLIWVMYNIPLRTLCMGGGHHPATIENSYNIIISISFRLDRYRFYYVVDSQIPTLLNSDNNKTYFSLQVLTRYVAPKKMELRCTPLSRDTILSSASHLINNIIRQVRTKQSFRY